MERKYPGFIMVLSNLLLIESRADNLCNLSEQSAQVTSLQCSDTVGWTTGRASGL